MIREVRFCLNGLWYIGSLVFFSTLMIPFYLLRMITENFVFKNAEKTQVNWSAFYWKQFFHGIVSSLASCTFRQMARAVETYAGVQVEFSGDKIEKHENAVLIANHITSVDFVVMLNIAMRKGMLGNIKFMSKDSLRWVPGLGLGMLMMKQIFLKRNWMKDQQSIAESFEELQTERPPVWLISYLEGTRITPKKLQQSQEFAKERGLPILNYVMYPRTKGFCSVIKQLQQGGGNSVITSLNTKHIPYVYDITYAYLAKNTKGNWEMKGHNAAVKVSEILKNGSQGCKDRKILINVKKHYLKDLPTDEEGVTNWVYAQWQRKEALLKELFEGNNNIENRLDWEFKGEPIQDEPFKAPDFLEVPQAKQKALLMEQTEKLAKSNKKQN